MNSFYPLAVFLLVIAVIAVFIYRKTIIHVLFAIITISIVFAVMRQNSAGLQTQTPIVDQVTNVIQSFTSWFNGAKSLYSALNTSAELKQKFDTFSGTQSLQKITTAYSAIKSASNSIPELALPTSEEVEGYTPTQKQDFFTSIADFFAELPNTNPPANDQVPPNAKERLRGMFTKDLALTTAQGEVIVYDLEKSLMAVYIRELQVPQGPELGVYMATVEPNNTLHTQDFLYIGPLKSTQGNQVYLVPKNADNVVHNTVFIYSPVLSQVYAIAPLR